MQKISKTLRQTAVSPKWLSHIRARANSHDR
jgi:hypothetical protein